MCEHSASQVPSKNQIVAFAYASMNTISVTARLPHFSPDYTRSQMFCHFGLITPVFVKPATNYFDNSPVTLQIAHMNRFSGVVKIILDALWQV